MTTPQSLLNNLWQCSCCKFPLFLTFFYFFKALILVKPSRNEKSLSTCVVIRNSSVMSLSSLTNQTLSRAPFKRPLTFLRTVFLLQLSGAWSVSSLVKGVQMSSGEHLPPSLTEPKALRACTTGTRGAPRMTWCQSVSSKRRRAFRASVQHNQTLTSLAGIERTHCSQLIIFFHAYIQG